MNQFKILKAARKRRSLSVRDFWYYDLEEMVHLGLLNKSYPKRPPSGNGWPAYSISRRGRKALKKTLAK